MRKTSQRIEAIGGRMQRVGQNLSIAVTAPLAALGVASFKAASDVAEMEAAFDQVFGNLADGVRQWAATTAKELGRSRFEIQQSALAFQELFSKSLGPQEAAEASKQFAVLTQDLASFKNLSEDVAQQKLFSGLIGEAEPLRSVGVFLSEARVEAKALELGIEGLNGKLTDQQKISIRAAIIQEDLASAQGDVLRTADGTANRLRAANAAFTDLRVEIGTKLIPALTPLIAALTGALTAFNQLPEGVQSAIVVVGGLAAAFGPLLYVMGAVTTAIAPLLAGLKTAATLATAAGTATGTLTVALAGLRGALLSLLASLGPYAIALGVIAGLYALLTMRSEASRKTTERYASAQREAQAASQKAADATNNLAAAHGEARKQALAQAKAEAENIKKKRDSAFWSIQLAKAELARAQAFRRTQNAASIGGGVPGTASFIQGTGDKAVAAARENAEMARKTFEQLDASLKSLEAAIRAPAPSASVASAGGVDKKSGGRTGRSGPSIAEIEARFVDELDGYRSQLAAAAASTAQSADERAELELRQVELARRATVRQIEADEDYSDAQKQRLINAVEAVAAEERFSIEFNRRAQLEQEAADIARIRFDNQREVLDISLDLADTEMERKRLALEILALEQAYRRSTLERILASQTAADAEKAQARALLDGLAQIEQLEIQATSRANETSKEAFTRELNKSPEQINEAIDQIGINGLNALNDALVDAIVNFKSLADVARQVVRQVLSELLRLQIQQALIKPLAGALGLTVPGFAKGTNFAPGGLAIVGERGPELVNLPRGSKVSTNSETSRMMGGNMTFNIYANDAKGGREAASQIAMRLRHTMNGR